MNLKLATHTKEQLETHFNRVMFEIITKRNQPRFLGFTFPPAGPNFPGDVVPFKLVESCPLPQNVYVTIVGRNLDFIYTTKGKVTFWQGNAPVAEGYVSPAPPTEPVNTSFKVVAIDDDNNLAAPSQEIMDALRQNGNCVFLHPDN